MLTSVVILKPAVSTALLRQTDRQTAGGSHFLQMHVCKMDFSVFKSVLWATLLNCIRFESCSKIFTLPIMIGSFFNSVQFDFPQLFKGVQRIESE